MAFMATFNYEIWRCWTAILTYLTLHDSSKMINLDNLFIRSISLRLASLVSKLIRLPFYRGMRIGVLAVDHVEPPLPVAKLYILAISMPPYNRTKNSRDY